MTKSKESTTTVIAAGDRVSHNLFGEGFAKEITRSGNGRDVHVYCEFDEATQRPKSMPATRFRKILSTYLEKIDWNDVVKDNASIDEIVVEGLEGSGLVQFNFSDEESDYVPTAEEEQEAASDNDSLETVDVQ